MHKSVEGPKMDVGCAAIPPEQDPQNLKPGGDRMDEYRPRRTLLKTHKPNWKDKDMVTSAFRDIVCDEYQKVRQSTFGSSDEISDTCGNDPLWEFNSLDVICESNEREYIELMTEMERLLHEDIAAQVIKRDRQLLEDYEKIVDDEDKYLAQAVLEHMQLNEKQTRFSGDDLHSWIFKAEQFFECHRILEMMKVVHAAMNFDGKVICWHRWLIAQHRRPDWRTLITAMAARFRPSAYIDYNQELSKIRQTGSVVDYHERFKELSNMVRGWPMEALMGAFVGDSGMRSVLSSYGGGEATAISQPWARGSYGSSSCCSRYEFGSTTRALGCEIDQQLTFDVVVEMEGAVHRRETGDTGPWVFSAVVYTSNGRGKPCLGDSLVERAGRGSMGLC
ncbi:hypothetical protein EJ110_NYTH07420 [Nymphaea thermarum]|nr:hypothetical protein EJ110_NYTH07420 [Nymphaea thermarum]